jgi:hypothetical protein
MKIVESQPVVPRVMTGAEYAQGRNTVEVVLRKPVSVEVEPGLIATYPEGVVEAPCAVVNFLISHAGAELPGHIFPDPPKPFRSTPSGLPVPTQGGMAGSIRFNP